MIFNETRYNSHWNTKKLTDLGVFARGKSKHRPRDDERLYEGGGYPLIQTGEVKAANLYITKHEQEYGEFGLAQSKLWDAGTLCITIAANIAETAILSYPMCFPDSVVGFRAFPEESSELFMHYVFTYIRNSIQNSVSGSIQDNINIDYLSQLDFKVPDKAYQDKVVSILGTLDQKIDTNNHICEELEVMAKTIYDYWFTQFDFPDTDGKPYRSSGGVMEWNEQLKREIPKGWKVVPVIEGYDVCYGFPFNTDLFVDDSTAQPVVRIRDIVEGSISAYTTEQVDGKYWLHPEDMIIGMDGNFHINFWDSTNALLNQRCVRIRSTGEYPIFMAYFASMPYIKARERTVSRTTVGHLSADDIKSLFILCPDESTLVAANHIFGASLKKICQISDENRELTKLRNWLLPMLMNGQVTVVDAEDEPANVIPFVSKSDTDQRFTAWLQNQGVAARGDIDMQTMREIFDAMDDDDK